MDAEVAERAVQLVSFTEGVGGEGQGVGHGGSTVERIYSHKWKY